MEKAKYSAQAKHIREKYARFTMNIRPEIMEAFKVKCKENATTPTTELKRFIDEYCAK